MPIKSINRLKNGFTLVELLVVIAIIGILIGMLLPAVQSVHESARRITCASNIRQLGLSMHIYESARGHLPFGWDEDGYTWGIEILPFIEQQNLHGSLERGANWVSGANAIVAATVVPIARCPTSPIGDHIDHNGVPDRVPADYRASIGSNVRGDSGPNLADSPSTRDGNPNGVFWGCSKTKFGSVTDGHRRCRAANFQLRLKFRWIDHFRELIAPAIGSKLVSYSYAANHTSGYNLGSRI